MAKKKNRGGGQQSSKPAEDCDEDKAVFVVGEDQADETSCGDKNKDDKGRTKNKEDKGTTKEKGDEDKGKEKGSDKESKGKKAPPPPVVTAVLKVDMHCDGCAKRIRASVRHYPGVEGVAMDVAKGTMTVVGRVDAKKLRDRVASKTKKKVDLVVGTANYNNNQTSKGKDDGDAKQKQGDSFKVHEYGKPDNMSDLYWLDKVYGGVWKPDNSKGSGGGGGGDGCGGGGKGNKEDKGCGGGGGGGKGNKGSGGGEGKKDKQQDDKGSGEGKGKDESKSGGGGGDKGKGGGKDNKQKPAVPVVGTVVLKIGAMGLHCDGCMNRVRAKLFKIKGVEQVAMDMAKNQVTVTGTMDTKALPGKLQKKVRRPVDVVSAKEGKQQDGGNPSKEGKDKQDGGGGGGKDKDKDKDAAGKALMAEMQMWKTAFYDQHALLHTEFMLSDENPNACSVM